MNSNDDGNRGRERLAELLRQELAGPEARPSVHRWARRRDQRVIPIELAADDGVTAAVESPRQETAEAERLAAESRARDLEKVVLGLRQRLRDLEATIQAVTHRAARAESATRSASSSPTSPTSSGDSRLYGQVGLAPGCPDFLVDAARRAYLREYHPDRHEGARAKERATADFQFYSRVFKVIEDERSKLRAKAVESR
jgi:hypothetical protein